MVHRLNVLSLNLKNIESSNEKVVNVEKFTSEKISEIINIDHKIFESYWQNSVAAFNETISSCTHNYLFVQEEDSNPVGYGILGITRNYGFLQRFGINKEFQQRGFGKKLLGEVIKFSKQKKLINIRLNTQEQNKHAQSLYLNNGFKTTNTNYLILGTSNTK
jgi:ribosomal protein S18 acetylase RimI-like enzyme